MGVVLLVSLTITVCLLVRFLNTGTVSLPFPVIGRLDNPSYCSELQAQWGQFLPGYRGTLLWQIWAGSDLCGFTSISTWLVMLTRVHRSPSGLCE